MNKDNLTRIYTHLGSVHSDELISIAIVLHVFYMDTTQFNLSDIQIFRSEIPDDLKVTDWVLDQGKVCLPLLRQIDHHQLEKENHCTFSLLLDSIGYHEKAELYLDWYRNFITLDCSGPTALASKLRTGPDVIYSLQSPFDLAIKDWFKKSPNDPILKAFLRKMGEHIVDTIGKYVHKMALLDKHVEIVDLEKHGLKALFYRTVEEDPSFGIRKWMQINKHNDAALSITYDERNKGWSIYRFGDHPKINLIKIKKEKDVTYVPRNGFVAKVKKEATRERLIELANKSLKR